MDQSAGPPAAAERLKRSYDAALQLLDRQVMDPDGLMVGKVDDLELVETEDGRLAVTALLCGPGALGPRLGGRPGHWVVAIWRRLRSEAEPAAARIPFSDVVRVTSAVHVSRKRSSLAVDGLERWVHDHVVSRIPGAGHAPE
jgi:sporulation protein YlmC with PRC-barrel domain